MVKTQEKKKDQKEENETRKKMEGKGQFYLLNLFA